MVTFMSRPFRAAGRAGLRGGVALTGAVILAGVLASPASAATVPRPAPGFVPGANALVTPAQGDAIHIFYQQVNHSLITVSGPWASEWGKPQNLGGVLTSGAAAIAIKSGFEGLANIWVFARGTGNVVQYREFAGARGSWGRWTRLGGRTALGAPGVTCPWVALLAPRSSSSAAPTERCGNARSAAAAGSRVAATSPRPRLRCQRSPGSARGRLDVFALGTDHAVWEFSGAWHRVGGKSASAPAAVRLPSGETDLFIRGSDNALWMNVRAPGAAAWRGWHRVGGFLTSAPAATMWPFSQLGKSRTVLALGRNGNLLIAHNNVGTSTWTWGQVP